MTAVLVPIRPKESKLERFERIEANRLVGRIEPRWCGRPSTVGLRWVSPLEPQPDADPRGCGYRITSRPSGLCRSCEVRG